MAGGGRHRHAQTTSCSNGGGSCWAKLGYFFTLSKRKGLPHLSALIVIIKRRPDNRASRPTRAVRRAPSTFVDLVTEACRELLFVVVGVALRSQVERGDYYGEGLRLELGGSWTGPDGVLITSCCFDIDGCGALVELSLGMGAGSLVRALRSRPTKALPIWRGTGSSNPPRSSGESGANFASS